MNKDLLNETFQKHFKLLQKHLTLNETVDRFAKYKYTSPGRYDTFEKYLDFVKGTLMGGDQTYEEHYKDWTRLVAQEKERLADEERRNTDLEKYRSDMKGIKSREREWKVNQAMSLLQNDWGKNILRDLKISPEQWTFDIPDSRKKEIQDKYYKAYHKQYDKKMNRGAALIVIGGLISAFIVGFAPEILTFITSLFEENKPGDIENGKEVTVKTPLSKIDDMFKSSAEKAIFNKVKSKIPSYFKVKYDPNLGKKVDLDGKKFMITVSDLDLAKLLINVGTNLEENIETDLSIKNLLQIAKTKGKDGLEKSISDKI